MTLQAQNSLLVAPLHVTSIGRFSSMPLMLALGGGQQVSNNTWPTANLAVYAPIDMPMRFTVARFMVANANSLAGNINLGLYDGAMSLLVSTGSTAAAGSAAVQYVSITARSFPPGHYYIALVCSSTSNTLQRTLVSTSARRMRECGFFQEALGSITLPNNMTPAAYTTQGWCYGFTQSATL